MPNFSTLNPKVTVFLLLLGALLIGGSTILYLSDTTEGHEASLQFVESADSYGLEYSSTPKDDLHPSQNFMGVAGVYVSDYTTNGYPDVLLVGGEQPALYENQGGEFEPADLPPIDGLVRSALFFDATSDGTDELVLFRMNATPVLLEYREGTFEINDVQIPQVLENPLGATSADFTGNGCNDIFIIQNGRLGDTIWKGMNQYDVPLDEDNGLPNHLLFNDCNSFSTVDDDVFAGTRWTLATTAVDVTGNGWPDIHEANDFNRDVLYLNDGKGQFTKMDLGAASNRNAMSSTISDVTGNGLPDIFVTNTWFTDQMADEMALAGVEERRYGNNLFINHGEGDFVDSAPEYNVEKGGWGWGAIMRDLTNNGQLDLVHATSRFDVRYQAPFSSREAGHLLEEYSFYTYPAVFQGGEGTFEHVDPAESGFHVTDGRGIAELDFNGNGLLDIIIANNHDEFKLYENQADPRSSIVLDVRGDETVSGTGARIVIETADETIYRWSESNVDYLSQGDRAVHVGLDGEETVDITIEWQNGVTDTFESVDANARYQVTPQEGIERLVSFE